ncbi:hypothetical protein THAOC_30648, partial [Thalassiosira oceanica]
MTLLPLLFSFSSDSLFNIGIIAPGKPGRRFLPGSSGCVTPWDVSGYSGAQNLLALEVDQPPNPGRSECSEESHTSVWKSAETEREEGTKGGAADERGGCSTARRPDRRGTSPASTPRARRRPSSSARSRLAVSSDASAPGTPGGAGRERISCRPLLRVAKRLLTRIVRLVRAPTAAVMVGAIEARDRLDATRRAAAGARGGGAATTPEEAQLRAMLENA